MEMPGFLMNNGNPTAMTESISIKATIDVKKRWDTMSADIANTFVNTDVGTAKIEERVIMKIKSPLVDILIENEPFTSNTWSIKAR